MSSSQDRAAVYSDNNWTSELSGLNITSVNIIEDARVISSPIETGTQSLDNKVIDPIMVIVKGVIYADSSGTIGKLEEMVRNRDWKFYSVDDGTGCGVNNLILKKFPTVRDVDKYDWIEVTLEFVQAMFVQSGSSGSPSNSEDSPVVNNGTMQGSAS